MARPKKSDDDKFNRDLRAKVPDFIGDAVDAVAKERCTTPSQIVREAVMEHLRLRGRLPEQEDSSSPLPTEEAKDDAMP